MATWSRTERTRETVEYSVPTGPWGACWNQVQQAIDAAKGEVSRGMDRSGTVSDDAIRVHARDDEIVISFDRPHGSCMPTIPTDGVPAVLIGTHADPQFAAHQAHRAYRVAGCGYCHAKSEETSS